MSLSLSTIEHVKLAATAVSTLGTALVTVGLFTPLVYRLTAIEPIAPARLELLNGIMAICVVGALVLHLAGQAILLLLEKHDE